MRGRFFHWPAIARALACLAVAGAIAAAAWYAAHQPRAVRAAARASAATSSDGLSAALARCQALGEAAENNPACLAAWAENRRGFFTYRLPAPVVVTVVRER
jgi:conjugative transfer region protein TrbK